MVTYGEENDHEETECPDVDCGEKCVVGYNVIVILFEEENL